MSERRGEALAGNACHGRVGGGEAGPAGDIAAGAIAVAGRDLKSHFFTGSEHRLSGLNADRRKRPFASPGAGAAGGDPGGQQLVVVAAHVEPLPAFVGHRHRGLGQQQARGGLGQIDAAAEGLPRDGEVVAGRIVAEEREPEASLASKRSMAAATVAAGL